MSYDASSSGRPDLVCFSPQRYCYAHRRPRQLMSRFTRTHRVFFVEEPMIAVGRPPRLDQRHDDGSVCVVTPSFDPSLSLAEQRAELGRLLARLYDEHHIDGPIAWYGAPSFVPATRHLPARAVVYDCDDASAVPWSSSEMAELEAELLAVADIVLTNGYRLLEAKRRHHRNVHAVPTGVDLEHFQRLMVGPEPIDQAPFSRPRLGFAGMVDERIDVDLLRQIATLRPSWQIMLLGPMALADPSSLQLPNIHCLGPKMFDELPRYMAGWDVAIVPLLEEGATRLANLVRAPEYMAGGCPVVSTPLRDVVRPYGEAGLVRIAQGAEAFVLAVEETMKEDVETRRRRHEELLRSMAWERMFARVARLVAPYARTEDVFEAWTIS